MRLLRGNRVEKQDRTSTIFEPKHTIKVCLGFFVSRALMVCFGGKEHTMYGKSTERDELRGRFTKWMEVTVYRARLNYLKAQRRRIDTIPLEDASIEKLCSQEGEEQWIQKMRRADSLDFEEEALAAAFSQLSALKKEVLTMLFLLDMTPQEIAGGLFCTVQYVYKQRSLALKKLREALKGGDAL